MPLNAYRTVRIGGLSKTQLLQKLGDNSISLNKAAEQLFANAEFTTSAVPFDVKTVVLTVRDLVFPQGAGLAEIYAKAHRFGLALCPLELGPHFRLQYLDQPEGDVGGPAQHRAPHGSITVASEILSPDEEVPKGFYVRRIQGVLWLRGYHCGEDHIWDPDDHFLFALRDNVPTALSPASV